MRYIKLYIISLVFLSLTGTKLYAQCADDSNYWIESWTSCLISNNPNSVRGNTYWLLFEFSEPQAISTTHFWNANRIGESSSGAKTVFIDVSINGSTWTQVGAGSYTWDQATELDTYAGFAGPDLQSYGFIEKILITFVDNHNGGPCVSVSELRFDIDQTACYGELDLCGVCNGPGYTTYYEDADGDGLGNPESIIEACTLPVGYVENNLDNCDNGLIGWQDVGVIFSENGCTGCHGGTTPASNLDLNTFEGISMGGNLCGSNILTGTVLVDVIDISNYNGCSTPIPFPSMNERVGGNIDAAELALIQAWVDNGALLDCNCPDGSPDIDGDGVCDFSDLCNGLDDNLIGTACDDGNPCTISEVITEDCECVGVPAPDSDFDGVCDVQDAAPLDPCTADGILGFPEPSNWVANGNNDCDLDGMTLIMGDLNDYDECINHVGSSFAPDCACPGTSETDGAILVDAFGMASPENAGGIPDNALTGIVTGTDYIDLEFPYMEIGTEICFEVGFNNATGGVQFEVNDLGFYKFINPNPSLTNYELQTVCFPAFVPGKQDIRITRLTSGGVKIDGATFQYCPCLEGDVDRNFTECLCPIDLTEDVGTYVESFGVVNPQFSDGAPDGIFTMNISTGDSLILSFPAMDENYEICIDVLFSFLFTGASFDFDNQNVIIMNPAGVGEEGQTQTLCFQTNSNAAQTVVLKKINPGGYKVDGSYARHCNACIADTDNDGVCDVNDLCPTGDDALDEDADGIPDACDTCNGNLIGQACDDSDNCTYNDLLDANCNCIGTPIYHDTIYGLQGTLSLHAIDSLSLINDFETLSDGDFKAGQVITILPGFETKEFMDLDIQIEDCNTGSGN